MKLAEAPTLSLEAGASHLTEVLRGYASAEGLPPSLREAWQAHARQAHLEALFLDQKHKEDWKYTPLSFLRRPWKLAPPVQASPPVSLAFSGQAAELVLPSEDLPALRSLPAPTSVWEALLTPAASLQHYALSQEGYFVLAPHGTGELSVHAATLSVAPGTQAEVLVAPSGSGFLLVRLHLDAGEGAQVRFFLPAGGGAHDLFVYVLVTARLAQEAQVETYDLTASVGWKRSEVRVYLSGVQAQAHLHGAAIVGQGSVVDHAIRVEHAVPHTASNQLFKALVYKGGHSAFQGRIFVHPHAQKTNAYQSHKALLWEPGAVAYSRPQLEIFADDVRCTHGVTTGFLEGEMLFYLRARGVPEEQARHLLAQGFLEEVLSRVPQEALRGWARQAMGFAE
ncbi:MAG: Fe-S cluster assembly protein SufD [Bacteroidia bacterium]|nr:MAG: Fe-S cluster assembly protein SufD [Bacteroidia bacterium]